MKKLVYISILLMAACSSQKETEFITHGFPNGVIIGDYKEKYNAFNGQYQVDFIYTNNSEKILEIPSLYADFYLDGKKVGYADGGAGYKLDAKGGNGIASVWTIMPEKKPDSIVFVFNGFFEDKKK